MGFFSRNKDKNPPWLAGAREFCGSAGIKIVAWGPNALVVEAKSAERAAEIAAQLSNLDFQATQDADDAYAGLLTLSHPD